VYRNRDGRECWAGKSSGLHIDPCPSCRDHPLD
jgi:hypothetical protein